MFAAALCLLMLLIAALAGLSFGSSSVSLGAFIRALIAGDTKSTAYRIMMHSRLPRVLGAMLCGSALAVAGVILQAVLLNPLAGPNTIGVNNGAGLLVLLCSAFLPEHPQLLPLAAFLGALATACLVFSVSIGSGVSKVTLVLAGAAVSFCGMIGFVGLIVPHIFRHLVGSDHRRLVPCCALGGAAFVTLAIWLQEFCLRRMRCRWASCCPSSAGRSSSG